MKPLTSAPIIGPFAARLIKQSFSDCAIVAGLVIIGAALAESQLQSGLFYATASITALAVLFIYALAKLDEGLPFNATSAAEVIVALGIASVVAGLVVSLWSFLTLDIETTQISLAVLRSSLSPFIEGLACAACARHCCAGQHGQAGFWGGRSGCRYI